MKRYVWLLVMTGLFAGVVMAFTVASKESKKQGVVVFTKAVSNITSSTATCSFRVTAMDLGKLKGVGVCVAGGPQATVNNFNFPYYGPLKAVGDYVVNLKNLRTNTSMYARAWAKTDTGYVYGNPVAFKTLPPQKPQ